MHFTSRRDFLRNIAISGAAAAAPGFLFRCASQPAPGTTLETTPIESIAPVAPAGDGEALLSLPDGFSYAVIGEEGTPMADGTVTPGLNGGIGAFAFRNHLRVIRSHGAVNPGDSVPGDGLHVYDPVAGGMITSIDLSAQTGEVLYQFVSMRGTTNNAGGGTTPWRSWILCEATTRGVASGYTQPHGYCFDVRADIPGGVIPVPLKAMGRFVHASVCVDPDTQIAYLTEHAQPGAGFYRFVPRRPNSPVAGGTLQMLTIARRGDVDLREWSGPDPLPVDWVTILDADPQAAEDDPQAVFRLGLEAGGLPFGRGGGVVYDDGALYFATLDGSDRLSRKLWEYRVRASHWRGALPGELVGTIRLRDERADLSARIASELCAAPDGTLLMAERSARGTILRAFTRGGRSYDFANVVSEADPGRFGGATFSPDGSTLFLNQQSPGRTFAIRGPWARLGL